MKLKSYLLQSVILAIILPSIALARDWSSYSSENFTIYSDVSPKRAVELIEEFEIFRRLAFMSVGMQPKPSRTKMKILLVH